MCARAGARTLATGAGMDFASRARHIHAPRPPDRSRRALKNCRPHSLKVAGNLWAVRVELRVSRDQPPPGFRFRRQRSGELPCTGWKFSVTVPIHPLRPRRLPLSKKQMSSRFDSDSLARSQTHARLLIERLFHCPVLAEKFHQLTALRVLVVAQHPQRRAAKLVAQIHACPVGQQLCCQFDLPALHRPV